MGSSVEAYSAAICSLLSERLLPLMTILVRRERYAA